MFKVMVLLNSEVPLTQGDMYEFRLDAFPSIELDQIKTLMKGRRVIFTYPGASENMIRSLLDLEPEYIDLDYRTPLPFVAEVRKRCKVICSYHNFHETPLDLEKLPLFEADEQKVATMAHSTLDALRMLHYVKGKSHFTGICMGEEGKITRQLAPLIGSTFNFIPVGAPSAPGQLSLQELYPCNRDTQIYGLIGDPVTFSPSHYTHNQVFKAFNLNSIYVKMSVKEGELKSFFELIDTLPFQGLSVTIPHKEKVLPGAIVNTLKKIKGEWQGRNTDGIGAIQAIEKRMPIQGKELLFIGAGGAAKGVMQEASQRGARVKFYNRSIQKNEFRQIFDREPYDILINTTPVYEEIPFNAHWIEEGKLVFDMITLPRETALIHYAKKKGCPVIYGEEMFVYQAAEQFKWWFDGALDEDKVITTLFLETRQIGGS